MAIISSQEKHSLKSQKLHLIDSFRILGLFFLLFGSLTTLNAQDHESLTAYLSVPIIQKLSVQDARSFPSMGTGDIERGYIEVKDAVTLFVSSNVSWRVVISSPKTNLYVSPGRFKSVEDFQWRVGRNPFRSISQNPVVVMAGEGGVKGYKIVIDYRLKLGWHNTPPGRWELEPEFRVEPNYGTFLHED